MVENDLLVRHYIVITFSIGAIFATYEFVVFSVPPHVLIDYGLGLLVHILVPIIFGLFCFLFSFRMVAAVIEREVRAASGLACGIFSGIIGAVTLVVFGVATMSV